MVTERIRQGEHELFRIQIPALKLVVEAGPDHPADWILSHPTIRIGSHADNDLVLTDPAVSRFHAQILFGEGKVKVRDLGSTNGTWVRGVRVSEAELPAGECVTFGKTAIRVRPSQEKVTSVPPDLDRMGPFIGRSDALKEAFSLLRAASSTSAPIHLSGESGTGKELAARYVHEASGRPGELVAFDCGRVQPELIASELFGHRKGSFTGAADDRTGAFRAAHHGTLFLDELGELPLILQPNLLRALETREVQPIGVDRPVPVDVRLVTATNRDLEEMSRAGSFRVDLYYRVSVIVVRLPPLRERREDIPLLVEHFTRAAGAPVRIADDAMALLHDHEWVGNIRELRNVLGRLAIVAAGREATAKDLAFLRRGPASPVAPPPVPAASPTPAPATTPPAATLEDLERRSILETYERLGRNKLRTAQALGISRNRLKRKLQEFLGVHEDDDADGD